MPPNRSPADDPELQQALQEIRAGLAQARAEIACLDEETGDLPAALHALQHDATLGEPFFAVSGSWPRRARAWLQKVVYHLFLRRHAREWNEQQSRFNRATVDALAELFRRLPAAGSSRPRDDGER